MLVVHSVLEYSLKIDQDLTVLNSVINISIESICLLKYKHFMLEFFTVHICIQKLYFTKCNIFFNKTI